MDTLDQVYGAEVETEEGGEERRGGEDKRKGEGRRTR